MQDSSQWAANVIIADADYIDKVAFDLIVNFERMLERRIPQADMPKWAECIALDGGLRQGDNSVHVILIHDHQTTAMQNFVPANYAQELNGQAFKGPLGEFSFSAITTEGLASTTQLFLDTLQIVAQQHDVQRLMVIANDNIYNNVRASLKDVDRQKEVTVFAMQPMPGGNFRQEILGFSLMAALGIRGEELKIEK